MNDTILIVEDEPWIRELHVRHLTEEGFDCRATATAEAALDLVRQEPFALALLDINLPKMSGISLLKEIQGLTPDTVAIMVTGVDQVHMAMHCIQAGAEDYILKPFNINRVLLSIRSALEKRRLRMENQQYQAHLERQVKEQTARITTTLGQLEITYDATLRSLARALDAREKEVGSHSERVRNYSLFLAEMLGIDRQEQTDLAKGALLHDIGKIGISDNILLKPGKLTDAEWVEMKTHAQLGKAIIGDIPFLAGAAHLILTHHERYDGSGYPLGLRGEQIPLGARIFALADTLDAMTSDRPYRQALPYQAVVDEVRRCRGTQFDPMIADRFLGTSRCHWETIAGRSLA